MWKNNPFKHILGGLDTNYTGVMVVDDVDTKTFKQKDWDAYRNNHVGFVFQEYNLIPHQNVSKNNETVNSNYYSDFFIRFIVR